MPRKQILKFLRIKTKPVIEKFKNWIRHIRMSFYPYLLLALSGSGMICNVMSLFIFAKQRFRRNFHRLLVILAIYDFLVRFVFCITKSYYKNYSPCEMWADFTIEFTKAHEAMNAMNVFLKPQYLAKIYLFSDYYVRMPTPWL